MRRQHRTTYICILNCGKVTAYPPADGEGSHDLSPSPPSYMALMMQKTAWGSIVFVVASDVPGFAGKPARFMATECLKEEAAMMDLNSMDQRHLSFAKFKDTVAGEMHRQPLNGSIWQDGSHIPSEAAWRVRVVEHRDKGAQEIHFEARTENIVPLTPSSTASSKRKRDQLGSPRLETKRSDDSLYCISDEDDDEDIVDVGSPLSAKGTSLLPVRTKTPAQTTQESTLSATQGPTGPDPLLAPVSDNVHPQSDVVDEGSDPDFEITGYIDLEPRVLLPDPSRTIRADDFVSETDRLALLVKHTVYQQVDKEIWRECCLFMGWPEELKSPGRSTHVQHVEIKGMKHELDDWQGLAVVFHIIKMCEAGGSFNWDFPGFGKTVMTWAVIVVAYWFNKAIYQWELDRADPDKREDHSEQSSATYKQPADAKCPSGGPKLKGVQCPCVEKSLTRRLMKKNGPWLLLLPVNGLGPWKRHYDYFIGDDSPMKFEFWILHGDTKADQTLTPDQLYEKLVRDQWGKDRNLNNIIIGTTMWSYKSKVLAPTRVTKTVAYLDEEGDEWDVPISFNGIAWGHVVIDEHQTFRHGTSTAQQVIDTLKSFGGPIDADQYQQCKKQRIPTLQLDECRLPSWLFLSGTPYKRAADEISIYLNCLQKESWSKIDATGKQHPYWAASVENIAEISKRTKELIKAGENGQDISRDNVTKVATDTAVALGLVAISRNESSLWFGRLLKKLPKLTMWSYTVNISQEYLDDMEKLRKKEYDWMVDKHENRRITYGTWNQGINRYRVCSSFPALARIAMDNGLSLTQQEIIKNKWSMDGKDQEQKSNPYVANFKEITDSSRKLEKIMEDLKCRPKGTKALIFSAYPVVVNITEQYLKNKRYTVARMDGTVPYAKRWEMEAGFQDEIDHCKTTDPENPVYKVSGRRPQILVGTLQTMGILWTLTKATVAYLMEPNINPGVELQAAKRPHRYGQIAEVTFIRFDCPKLVDELNIIKGQETISLIMDNVSRVVPNRDGTFEIVDVDQADRPSSNKKLKT